MYRIRPWLSVGALRETQDLVTLNAQGVTAMLQLADSVEQPGITSLYLPTEDGEPLSAKKLSQGVGFVLQQRARDRSVLVACGLAISRSVTFAIAALKEAEQVSLLDALRAVRSRHPEARPHPILWRSLCDYYGEPVPYRDVISRDRKE